MKPINIIKISAALFLLTVGTELYAGGGRPVAENWKPRELEFSRFTLNGQGQRMRFFFHGNLSIPNREILRIKNEKIQGTPVLHIEDMQTESSTLLARLPCPHGFEVQPYTEYELSFQYKTGLIEEQPPSLRIEQWDINTDFIKDSFYPVPANDTNQWQKHNMTIKTGGKTHYLTPSIYSAKNGKSKLSVGGFIIEQVSETRALRPSPKIVVNRKNVKLEAGKNITQAKLPVTDYNYEIIADFETDSFAGTAVFALDWLDKYNKAIATDFCTVESEDGIISKWNAIKAQWSRGYNQEDTDNISLGMVKNTEKRQKGKTTIKITRLIFDPPQKANSIRLKLLSKHNFKGRIVLNKFSFNTY